MKPKSLVRKRNIPRQRNTWTPDIAFTTVDLPCATWPIVPVRMQCYTSISSYRWKRSLHNLCCTV